MKKTLFILMLGCGFAGGQSLGASLLFDLNSTSGGAYDGDTWNGLSTTTGTAQDHIGTFNSAASSSIEANKIYTKEGLEVMDRLTWAATKTAGGGLWAAPGTPGTTPSNYHHLPNDVTDSGYSFNNDANVKFTIGGLSSGGVYTLTFGGNGGMGQSSVINFNFTDMVSGSLSGTAGTVNGSSFQVSNPNAAAGYALTVQLTANSDGEISFSGTRQGSNSSQINLTYMSLAGDFAVVPEPAAASMGLLGLTALLMRRRGFQG